jgi:hypothetical protein
MADYGPLGGVKIAGFISPGDTTDTYAVIDTILGIDGLRNYSGTTTEVLSGTTVPLPRRRAGMIVGVEGGDRYFKLKDKNPWDFDLTDWEELNFSGGGSGSAITGGTYSAGTLTLVNGSGDTINVTGFSESGYWEESGDGNTALKDIKGNQTITGTSDNSLVGGGTDNSVFDTLNSVIIGSDFSYISGSSSTVTTGSAGSAIIGGIGNSPDRRFILDSLASSLLGGIFNTIKNTTASTIIGGMNHNINPDNVPVGITSEYSTIIGGVGNIIQSDRSSSIIGGVSNEIKYNQSYSGTPGEGLSGFNFIGGGSSNTIDGHVSSAIIGGANNNIEFDVVSNNTIIGGMRGTISGGGYDTLIGGLDNTINGDPLDDNDISNSIIGGENNIILTGTSSAIIGGGSNRLINLGVSGTSIQNSVIIGGFAISGTVDNTVYVPKLNIGDVYTGTSLYNLGIDENGFVVTGNTGGGDSLSAYTYSPISNTFTIGINNGLSLDAQINEMSGLTINGDLTVNGDSIFSGNSTDVVKIFGSGDTSPIFSIEGSVGELFTVTDSLTGQLFGVNNISGLPILEVYDDNTILMGNNLSPSLNTTIIETVNSGQSTLYSIPTTAYTGGFFEYTVKNSAGVRAGSIMSVFSGSSIEFNETTTNDIGDTSDVTFDMSVTGTSANLLVSTTSNNWEIKTIIRSI